MPMDISFEQGDKVRADSVEQADIIRYDNQLYMKLSPVRVKLEGVRCNHTWQPFANLAEGTIRRLPPGTMVEIIEAELKIFG